MYRYRQIDIDVLVPRCVDYIITDLTRDTSRGSHFRMVFEKPVTTEEALRAITLRIKVTKIADRAMFAYAGGSSGDIYFGHGPILHVQDDRVACGGHDPCAYRGDPLRHDTYHVRENNLDFQELEKIVKALSA